jgi:hypothetical protein
LQRLGNFGHGINLLIKSSTRYGGAREVFGEECKESRFSMKVSCTRRPMISIAGKIK